MSRQREYELPIHLLFSLSLSPFPSSRGEMNFNWIVTNDRTKFVHLDAKVWMEFCPSSIIWRRWPGNIERSTHATNYAALASANLGFLRGRRSASATVVPPQDSYNPPARTTQCIQRRENYFMRNSRWNCIYGEPVAGFVVDSCCNCLIYMKIGNSREPTHVISLLRCTIILLKGNSMRIFDLRWFICAALSIRDKIFFHFRLGKW